MPIFLSDCSLLRETFLPSMAHFLFAHFHKTLYLLDNYYYAKVFLYGKCKYSQILYLSQKLIMRKFFLDRVMLCYDCMHWQVLQTPPPFFSFILPFVLLLFFHTETIGQQCGNEEPIESLYVSSKEMPLFPDGEKGLLDFLNENLKISSEKRVRAGSFVVAGVVNKLGEFQNVTIIQGTTGINDDIVRVCEMLRFTPGKQNGEFVEVLYSFSLHITYGGYITDLSFDTGISSERLWDMYFDAIDPYRNVTPYPYRNVTSELDTGPFYKVEKCQHIQEEIEN